MSEIEYKSDFPYIDYQIIESTNSKTFTASAVCTASSLFFTFKEILKKAEKPFDREPYQIVFFWRNGIMRLRFDALTWFDYVLPKYSVPATNRASIGSE